jgi:ribonuclease HIII
VTTAPALDEATRLWIVELKRRGISAAVTGTLVNGLRAEVRRGGDACRVNLHFSASKGFSVVYAGGERSLSAEAAMSPSMPEGRAEGRSVGMDEAGKGDYFGPLAAAAVCLGPGQGDILRGHGVADSKTLPDKRILKLADLVRETAEGSSVVLLSPDEYNNKFIKFRAKGLNSLDMLAELHGRALGQLLERCPGPANILLDKFCSAKRLSRFMPDGVEVELRTGAEADTAVAAASILARAAYVRELDRIRSEYGVDLPAGSAAAADQAGRDLVALHGSASLHLVAKYHFRNTERILAGSIS